MELSYISLSLTNVLKSHDLQKAGCELFLFFSASTDLNCHPDFYRKFLWTKKTSDEDSCWCLGGGFQYFLFSSLPGEMIQFD